MSEEKQFCRDCADCEVLGICDHFKKACDSTKIITIDGVELTPICDNKRHMICLPYSIKNLHLMARHFKLGMHWFHKDHYDMPKRRIIEITNKCVLVGSRVILRFIKNV